MARKTQAGVTWRPWREFIMMLLISPVFSGSNVSVPMGCLRLVGSFKLYVSFAEYSLFYRALLQKRPMFVRSLLIVATPYQCYYTVLRDRTVTVLARKVESVVLFTGWRRLVGSPKLQIIFHKRATKYKSLLRKMTYKDKGSYESSPPCTWDRTVAVPITRNSTYVYVYVYVYVYA